ncbi:hypothetical protein ABB37_08416 [Leptomonas pyrrhocoris]|uniref:Uncharacterized protein n=1 Tax=Leptomonas pyrrhocoris TaxID=157538 RepID=A0A0N0VDK0_LEPPY|nr:hypothetical protein ABB37_08416 [Leptomonas pyrrhocoris]KPA75524.1 hypothetical protein ABB37_08416 [Leptomonas pyrrhocoris]|eukprot:XP_015653963.1 hypothetical protein ABB37_08416 [Leptomonas pyrrhocoris]
MAKSSRSKWKKLHRRQKAKEESTNTVKRITQLHKKLELTIKGGISAVPPQEPEKRFHFLNPELDPRVPNTRKDLNNNYRAELNHVHYDYTKPLQLVPPKTNFYGKTDTTAPHPMTQRFETIDADAPIGGHALTKADMERMARRQMEKEAEAAARGNEEAVSADEHAGDDDGSSSNHDEPEEFTFGMEDAAPRRVGKASTKKSASTPGKKAKKGSGAAASSPSVAMLAAAAAEEDMEDEPQQQHSSGDNKVNKITSMQALRKKNGVTVSAGGASKMKGVGSHGGASGTRVVSSGSKAAQKKTGKKKDASK